MVAWDAPESDGGSPITKYKVEKRDATRAAYIQAEEVDGKTLKAKVTKLTEGNKYFFQVAAENEVGLSDWTETTEPVEAKMPFGIISTRIRLPRFGICLIQLFGALLFQLCIFVFACFHPAHWKTDRITYLVLHVRPR